MFPVSSSFSAEHLDLVPDGVCLDRQQPRRLFSDAKGRGPRRNHGAYPLFRRITNQLGFHWQLANLLQQQLSMNLQYDYIISNQIKSELPSVQ